LETIHYPDKGNDMPESTKRDRNKNIPASYLVPVREGRVLLIRRFNTGYEDGKYSLIAGHVEAGENFTDCVIREAGEESGLRFAAGDVRVAHVMHRNAGHGNERIDVFFVTDRWEGEPENREPEKCDDMRWFPLDGLPKNTIPYIRQALENIRDGVSYSEHGWD